MSGPPLGRPKNNPTQAEKKQAREDEKVRNGIEGKFGQSKRRFGLNRVMAKLSNTSETAIAITILVMNLVTLLRQISCLLFCQFLVRTYFFRNIHYLSLWRNNFRQSQIMISHIENSSALHPQFF